MHAHLKVACPHLFIQRIENLVDNGTPDSWISYGQGSLWAELKQLKRVPVTKFKMPWRPGQLAWYKRMRRKSDADYFVILTIDKQWYLLNSKLIEMKEFYTMEEIKPFFICHDYALSQHQPIICRSLHLND